MSDEGGTYRLDLSMSLSFSCDGEDEFITHVRGDVVRSAGVDGETETTVGSLHAIILDVSGAWQSPNTSLAMTLDDDAFTAQYLGIVGPDDQFISEIDEATVFVDRLLILERIEIKPEWRGLTLGLWATYKLLDALAPTSVLPVLIPMPLQFAPGADEHPEDFADFSVGRAEAFMKVRSFWRTVGFEKVCGGDDSDVEVWILDPTARQPDRRALLRDWIELP